MQVSVFTKLMAFFQVFVARAVSAFFNGIKLGVLTLLLNGFATTAFAQADDLIPIIDWQKRQTNDERLTAFGDDLMGDTIDPNLGSISFQHTDISLPGNSGLEVAVRRRLNQGYKYDEGVNVEFGDWELDVPKITAVASAQYGWAGQRCNGTWDQNFPYISKRSTRLYRHSYMDGVSVSVPGQGSQTVLRTSTNTKDKFPSNAKAHTASEWYFTCTNGEGFIGHAPNGHKYHFGKFISRPYKELGFARNTGDSVARVKILFAATRVEDQHGNYVNYTYSGNRLTKIQANDGRVITLGYSGNLISTVTANGRVWQYSYRKSNFVKPDWDPNNQGPLNSQVLDKVTRPDGLFWKFNLDGMNAEPSPAAKIICAPGIGPINLKHPNGAVGDFVVKDTRHRQAYVYYERGVTYHCSHTHDAELPTLLGGDFRLPPPIYREIRSTRAISVISKSITHPSLPPMNWSFDYEEDKVCDVMGVPCQPIIPALNGGQLIGAIPLVHSPANVYYNDHKFANYTYKSDAAYGGKDPLDHTNWTKVTNPDGSVITYYHHWNWEEMFGGKEVRKTVHKNSVLMDQTDTVYVQQGCGVGSIGVGVAASPSKCPTHAIKMTQRRDGDTYKSEYWYNTNPSAADYSYGNPVKIETSSSVSVNPRRTELTYTHNKSKWILGLRSRAVLNDLEVATATYDTFGRKTAQTRYGKPYMTFGYHGAAAYKGALYWVKDAIGRTTYLLNYKRGTPQQIKRPDGLSEYQYVDNNGWLTSNKDAMNRTTNYTHDNMGRLKTIDPTGNFWSVTAINYHFPASGAASQTITRGSSLTTIVYDAMFRPTLEKTQALDTGWESHVRTVYDGMGRVSFKSQPSTSPAETKGVDTTYDGLGRMLQTRENVAPYAATKYWYTNSHRVRVVDPSGAFTDYYSYGYDGPDNDDYRAIYQYDQNRTKLRHTYMYKNVRGQMTRLRQWGHTQGGVSVDQSQWFVYDDQQRLSGYETAEGSSTWYEYDKAGQMAAYATGMTYGGGGAVAANDQRRVALTHDQLGRVTKIDFAHSGTPDILKTYDANGNIKTVSRNGVNWTYTYNDADLLTAETLKLDGHTFTMNYVYNSDGHMTRRKLPSGRWIDYTPDGLGRTTEVKSGSQTLASGTNYHSSGAVTAMNYGNGQRFTQTLNARLLPERMRSAKGSTLAIDLAYLYDARGKIVKMTDRQSKYNTRDYKYDGLGQLIEAKSPSWGTASYTYDSLGNIRQKKVGSRTINMTYDSRNILRQSTDTGETGTRTIAYDRRGNVTTLGTMAFVYDYSDQPVIVSGSAGGIDGATGATNGNYTYDGNLKRVKSVVNGKTIYNIYDAGGALVYVHEMFGNKKTEYVNGPMGSLARYTNDVVTYLHNNHLGSPRVTTNSAGGYNGWSTYTPFGEEWSVKLPADQAGFTGHIKDSTTGLNYMQARYYDPVIGRFLSIDPVTFMDTGDPRYFNRYSYTANDPINLTDPTGENFIGNVFNAVFPPPQDRANLTGTQLNISRGEQGQFNVTESAIQNLSAETTEGIAVVGTALAVSAGTLSPSVGSATSQPAALTRSAKATNPVAAPIAGSAGGPGAGANFSKATQDGARAASGNTCVFCKTPTIRSATPAPNRSNIDHAIPKARGGNNSPGNAQNTCQTCNLQKGTQTTEEFLNRGN